MSGFNEDIKNEYLSLLEKYDQLGWKFIPLEGKRPFWKGWDDPEKWYSGEYSNEETINEIVTSRFKFNVGIVTGSLSKILRIDVDQPKILGWNPEPAIKKGGLAHTTSRGVALVVRSENPEVLAFSKKLVKRKEEIDQSLLFYPEDAGKETVTILEILGDGRQFVAPPSIHPDKRTRYEWLTPLPNSPDQILTINSIEELYSLLLECCANKELINELFEDYFKEKSRADTGEEGKKADDLLEKWLEILLKHLDVADDKGNYISIHCPFHPPDEKPSFAIYRNTYLAVDFHYRVNFNENFISILLDECWEI
ncbi:bifunctional DNA primase/polymerase [Archaeoglobus profundus]|uniref:Bifunctional DNA primase/polymerase n=1 Tax=Archaeoglobus profundus (strain DSM 5631 / JCM 9629 / NBRC 100127 / Av18) TaxID=572546 RepID=D2RI83_ARCPA|nr:bifunctional DNA primase/polymerase [Archaeoglobus profundus]ADB58008.1 Bifunctional DNA primase/polymerase [Archaeoglobus profundus DSM 5631]